MRGLVGAKRSLGYRDLQQALGSRDSLHLRRGQGSPEPECRPMVEKQKPFDGRIRMLGSRYIDGFPCTVRFDPAGAVWPDDGQSTPEMAAYFRSNSFQC